MQVPSGPHGTSARSPSTCPAGSGNAGHPRPGRIVYLEGAMPHVLSVTSRISPSSLAAGRELLGELDAEAREVIGSAAGHQALTPDPLLSAPGTARAPDPADQAGPARQ